MVHRLRVRHSVSLRSTERGFRFGIAIWRLGRLDRSERFWLRVIARTRIHHGTDSGRVNDVIGTGLRTSIYSMVGDGAH